MATLYAYIRLVSIPSVMILILFTIMMEFSTKILFSGLLLTAMITVYCCIRKFNVEEIIYWIIVSCIWISTGLFCIDVIKLHDSARFVQIILSLYLSHPDCKFKSIIKNIVGDDNIKYVSLVIDLIFALTLDFSNYWTQWRILAVILLKLIFKLISFVQLLQDVHSITSWLWIAPITLYLKHKDIIAVKVYDYFNSDAPNMNLNDLKILLKETQNKLKICSDYARKLPNANTFMNVLLMRIVVIIIYLISQVILHVSITQYIIYQIATVCLLGYIFFSFRTKNNEIKTESVEIYFYGSEKFVSCLNIARDAHDKVELLMNISDKASTLYNISSNISSCITHLINNPSSRTFDNISTTVATTASGVLTTAIAITSLYRAFR